MLFTSNPAMKLVSLTLATLIYSTSVTAAPVINAKVNLAPVMSHGASDVECVKVTSPALLTVSGLAQNPIIVNGEVLHITLDALGCDPALTESSQPWILSLVDKSQGDTVKLADITTDKQGVYNWFVNAPSVQSTSVENVQPLSESVDTREYILKVEGLNQNGDRLVGKSNAFVIVDTPILQRRQSVDEDDSALPGPPKADLTQDVDPTIAAPAPEEAPKIEVPKEAAPVPEIQHVTEPVVDVDPTILSTPEAEAPAVPAKVEPLTPVDSAKVEPGTSSVTEPSPTIPLPADDGIVHPTQSRFDPFYKYAAAGGALLSLIGFGVGGIVGGLIGGTVGLVAGLILAGINTFILG